MPGDSDVATRGTTDPADTDGAVVKLRARDVEVRYSVGERGSQLALAGVDLDVYDGEFVSMIGPSGCGKTTFLSATDGLLPITAGTITVDGKAVKKPGADRAVVFQDPCLLPWRSILRNVAYGLELRGTPKQQARERAREMIALVGLSGYEDRYPRQLSGGMKQRVNLARALAIDPEILLLDEPFAALDAQTRERMQAELLQIWAKAQKTALLVTHQIDEAIYLSDRVVVLTRGPGVVKETVPIDLPRPRKLDIKRTDEFHEYENRLWALIKDESEQSEVDDDAS